MRVLVRENFRYASGQVARQQDVEVVLRGTTTQAPLYQSALGSPVANPVRTDGVGNLSFYVEEGEYDFLVFGARVPFDADAPSGGGAIEEARAVHVQTTPSSSWLFNHGLGIVQQPVVVLDSAPDEASYTDVEVIDLNTLALSFDTAVTGKAYL